MGEINVPDEVKRKTLEFCFQKQPDSINSHSCLIKIGKIKEICFNPVFLFFKTNVLIPRVHIVIINNKM